jgi:hypothetical protein
MQRISYKDPLKEDLGTTETKQKPLTMGDRSICKTLLPEDTFKFGPVKSSTCERCLEKDDSITYPMIVRL